MSTIQRSVKRGNVRSFDASYRMGFKSAWASEVDADFDILYNAWNFGLDGSLAIADNSITTAKLMDGAVTNPKLAVGSVRGGGGGNIVTGSVDARTDLLDRSITSIKIAANAVTNTEIAPLTILQGNIATAAITTPKISDGNVTEPKIGDGAVSTRALADLAVTDAKIASLSWSKITGAPPAGGPPAGAAGGSLQGTYPNPTLRSNSVTFAEILDGTVSITELSPNVIARFVPPYAAGDDNKVLTVAPGGGGLNWVTTPPASLSPGQVSTIFLADAPNGVTDAKITSVSWGKVTGAPTSLPPGGPAGGDLVGTYPNPTLKPGLIPTTLPPTGTAGGDLIGNYPSPTIRPLAVVTGALAPLAVTDAKVNDVAWSKITGAPAPPTTLPPTGPAGGDLGSAYPNPTVVKSSPATFGAYCGQGSPVFNFSFPANAALLTMARPLFGIVKGRIQQATNEYLYLTTNMDAAGNAFDDGTQPSWGIRLAGTGVDAFNVRRAPANSLVWADLLALDGTGKLTLPSPGPGGSAGQGDAVVFCPRTVKGRLTSNNVAAALDAVRLTINQTAAVTSGLLTQDDPAQASWELNLRSALGSGDDFRVLRTPPGSTAQTSLLQIRGSDGKTVCSLADASVTSAMLAAGATVPAIATVVIPLNLSLGTPFASWLLVVNLPAITVKAGQRVLLLSMAGLQYTGSNTSNIVFMGWARNGSVFGASSWTFSASGSGFSMWPLPSLNYVDTPGAGTFTYGLYVNITNNAGSVVSRADNAGALAAIALG